MEIFIPSLIISGAILVGAMSPGPSFVLIARVAVGSSRKDAILASLGMGLGGVVFCILALMGIHIILTQIPILYFVFKIAGGSYLLYIAYLIWSNSSKGLTKENSNENSSTSKKIIFF